MNRRQTKFAIRKASGAQKLALEIAEAWDQATVWNARLDHIAALDADYDPTAPTEAWADADDFFASFAD
ncbi:hypothetical protein [Nocardia sp. NBC_01327]|uniref:hypothetical protein n=1 Tax=Nocardia sp. NBC_01327 TaxID=2903593 RepID=UPI002E14DD0F|nr:hypothetical protein OG326_23545 [Nocardia sp. NBC_01327]